MIYRLLENTVSRLLRIPPAPGPPPGDEGTTRVFRASPRYYAYRLVGWAPSRPLALLAVLTAAGSIYTAARAADGMQGLLTVAATAVGVLFLVQTLFSYAALRLDYEKRWYLLTDRSLRVRQGVVHVTEMTITFANIQNISTSQGPIQRLFGISDLRVDTAGGAGAGTQARGQVGVSMHTAFFRGVDDAPRIRALIEQRLRKLKDAGLGDLDDRSGGPRSASTGKTARAPSPRVLAALRQVRDEARALRVAAAAE